MLSYYPWWMVSLYRIREFLVSILGLVRHEKPETLPSIKPEGLSFKPGKNASFFIVRDAKEDMYWVSETLEDKHLTALFGVIAEKLSQNRTRYHVFTSVKYLHWTGPAHRAIKLAFACTAHGAGQHRVIHQLRIKILN